MLVADVSTDASLMQGLTPQPGGFRMTQTVALEPAPVPARGADVRRARSLSLRRPARPRFFRSSPITTRSRSSRCRRRSQRKFPLQRTVSQIFDVVLSNPVVGLLPDRNRVSVRLDARLSTPVHAESGQRRVHAVEPACLRRRRAIQSILMSPNVDDSSGHGRRRAVQPANQRGRRALATQLLDRYPIYTFKPEQLQFAGVNYEPGTITILTNGIRVQILEK